MTGYIRHETTGTVHSIDDDRLADAVAVPGWAPITEDEAREAHPALFGTPDPAVEAVQSHDGAGRPVRWTAGGAPIAPSDENP